MYQIKTGYFSLMFEPFTDHDRFLNKVRDRLRIVVSSYGFSADVIMNIGKKMLSEFSAELYKLYDNLEGRAELEEIRGRNRITFSYIKSGHIFIKGELLKEQNTHVQELRFENKIDQTELRAFSKALYHDYCK